MLALLCVAAAQRFYQPVALPQASFRPDSLPPVYAAGWTTQVGAGPSSQQETIGAGFVAPLLLGVAVAAASIRKSHKVRGVAALAVTAEPASSVEDGAAAGEGEQKAFRAPARNDFRFVEPEDAPWSHVYVRNGDVETALRTLRKRMNQAGILREIRQRRTFESNHDKELRKYKEGLRRKAFERKRRMRN